MTREKRERGPARHKPPSLRKAKELGTANPKPLPRPPRLKWMIDRFEGHSTPFVLACTQCEVGDEIPSAKVALDCGWVNLEADDGTSWNYLGTCPECWKREWDSYQERTKAAEFTRLAGERSKVAKQRAGASVKPKGGI